MAVSVAAGAALVFEQSPANEALRTHAGLEALDRTGDAIAVGLVVAALTVVIEMIPTVLIALGLHIEGGAVQRLKARMIRNRPEVLEPPPPSAGRSIARIGTDVAVALGLGAGLVTVRRHVTDPAPTLRGDIAVGARATILVAGVSGLIGYLAGGGLANADKVGLATPAGWIVDYGTDTRFWVAVLVVGYLVALVVRLVRRRIVASGTGRSPAVASGDVVARAEAFLAAIPPAPRGEVPPRPSEGAGRRSTATG